MTLKPETKICTKCGEEKSLEEFYKDRRRKDGFYPQCKICLKKYQRKYKEQNRDKYLEHSKKYQRKYREQNRDKRLEENRKYYEQNRDKRLEYSKKYHEQNQDYFLEHSKKYSRKCRINLVDNYIKKILSQKFGIKFQDITPELIEQKRAIIQLKRLIKQLKQKENEASKCQIDVRSCSTTM